MAEREEKTLAIPDVHFREGVTAVEAADEYIPCEEITDSQTTGHCGDQRCLTCVYSCINARDRLHHFVKLKNLNRFSGLVIPDGIQFLENATEKEIADGSQDCFLVTNSMNMKCIPTSFGGCSKCIFSRRNSSKRLEYYKSPQIQKRETFQGLDVPPGREFDSDVTREKANNPHTKCTDITHTKLEERSVSGCVGITCRECIFCENNASQRASYYEHLNLKGENMSFDLSELKPGDIVLSSPLQEGMSPVVAIYYGDNRFIGFSSKGESHYGLKSDFGYYRQVDLVVRPQAALSSFYQLFFGFVTGNSRYEDTLKDMGKTARLDGGLIYTRDAFPTECTFTVAQLEEAMKEAGKMPKDATMKIVKED